MEEAYKWDSGLRSLSLFIRTLIFDTVVYPEVAKEYLSSLVMGSSLVL